MDRQKNLSELKRRLTQRLTTNHSMYRFLLSKGISNVIAEEIMRELIPKGIDLSRLKEVIADRLQTAPELTFSGEQPTYLALIGPTGVGKTTTLLKLAEFYSSQGKKIGLISLDREKGETRIGTWANRFAWPLIENLEEISTLDGCDLVLIDTMGCNYYQPARIDALGELMVQLPKVELMLTLSAATKDVDIYGAIHQFSALTPSSIIFTKLDETLALGVLVNVCAKTSLPIRYIAFGYPMPGEIQIANSQNITKKILADLNQKEFQRLRHLSLSVL